MTVFVSESDTYEHHALATEIIHRAHGAGLPGASMFRGIEGFGAGRAIHTNRILSLSDELPIVVVVIGTPEVIDDFVPQIAPLLHGGLLIVEEVEIVQMVRPTGAEQHR